ncbi:multicopper oxidase domain-containing protein [Egibacter rhizosphaerae]|uniref:multicopper oxidase domain-containing protein n=1 Tax=Egibacter rhizosphaerae TaxID=1670831 RepID=UPI00197ABD43|nr:multicopper oxidase domain-containing protein [Egibacter rhizosphaerae]
MLGGTVLGAAGLVGALWWPLDSRVGWVLGAWFVLVGGALAASGIVPRWRRWPWGRPRRRAMRWGIGALTAVPLPLLLGLAWLLATAPVSNVGEQEFRNELAIPELLEPRVDAHGRKVFDLEARRGQRSFLPGTTTDTEGVNGDYLGPTLRASRGDTVRINVANGLDEPTTMHWHGMHLPAAADGGPHQIIAPGETWPPEWTIDQPAGTLWYHPHLHGKTGAHVYQGLAGMFIVDDEDSGRSTFPPSTASTTSPSSCRTACSTRTARSARRRRCRAWGCSATRSW